MFAGLVHGSKQMSRLTECCTFFVVMFCNQAEAVAFESQPE